MGVMSNRLSSSGGWSLSRWSRLREIMALRVAEGHAPGLVALVSRWDDLRVEAIGHQDLTQSRPMQRDSIFRISSMTKPVTAAAAMILVEECKIRLDDPVDRFLPELADRRVLSSPKAALDDTVPARRAITLRDLLTFRCGFGALMMSREDCPIAKAIAEAGLAVTADVQTLAPDELMKRLGALPLVHQPGEVWMYHTASDVLGVLIARASGQSFADFLADRLFKPLGMKDTAFHVSAEKRSRFTAGYLTDAATGALQPYDTPDSSQWAQPPVFAGGAAGLVSTADDYLAFCRMLLMKGRYGRERILSRRSVDLMTRDQITLAQKAASPFMPGFWDNRGWGFGLSVITREDDLADVPGRFGADGGLGTSAYTDPEEGVIGILMTQASWTSPVAPAINRDFWTLTYQAIDD